MTARYIFSQGFIVLTYMFLIASYLFKDHRKILLMNILGTLMQCISYFLLDAWSGFAVCIVAIFRSLIFLIQSLLKKNDQTTFFDIATLVFLNLVCVALCFFTYDGPLSLLSIFATIIYTISVWQKNPTVYRYLGVINSMCWIVYNIFVNSIFGFACESILFVCIVVGLIWENFDFKTPENQLNKNLQTYMKKLFPKYQNSNFDNTTEICAKKNITNKNMVFVIDCFSFASQDSEISKESFEKIFVQDKKLKKFFSEEQLDLMKIFLYEKSI